MIKSLISKLFGNKPTAVVSPPQPQPVVPNTTHKHTVPGNAHQRRIARRSAERNQDKVDQRDFSDYPTLIDRRDS